MNICMYNMTLYKKFIAGIIELGLTEEEIKKWQYCGGDYASHQNYFELRFPKKKLPYHVQWCVCGHDIKRNAYICNEAGDYNSIIPIGSCCIKHFMTNGLRRTCETCGVIHQNRTTNKCNDCRTLCCGIQVKKDGKCFQCKKKEDIEKNYESCFQCETLKRIGVECSECITERIRIENLRLYPEMLDMLNTQTVWNEPKKCECGKQIASHYKRCYACNYLLKEATCIECHKKFDNKGTFTRCFDCASLSKKAFVPKYKNNVIRKCDVEICNECHNMIWCCEKCVSGDNYCECVLGCDMCGTMDYECVFCTCQKCKKYEKLCICVD